MTIKTFYDDNGVPIGGKYTPDVPKIKSKTAANGTPSHKTKVKYSQYEPMIVTDEFNNDYICLNKYEAESVKRLLDMLHEQPKNFNTGDWFYDVPAKIGKWLAPKSNVGEESK